MQVYAERCHMLMRVWAYQCSWDREYRWLDCQ